MPLDRFLKLFFKDKIPSLSSYSDIYDLAFDYFSNNKNKKHLRKILEQAVTLNIPINEEDVFYLHFIASQLIGFRIFNDAKIICHKILDIEPHDYQAI